MKLPKLSLRKKKPKAKECCHKKVELALKELEDLTKEAKDFFVPEDNKDNKDGGSK